jgi:hypothetical protein
MLKFPKLSIRAAVAAAGLSACVCLGAGTMSTASATEDSHEQSWNREQKTNTKSDARANFQQKAEQRAQQRQDRLASSAWYGMSSSRPSSSATPFTSRYGNVWEMPGNRPYSWTPPWTRPTYVFTSPYYY